MGYLIFGFLLGAAVSWYWQDRRRGDPAFQQLLKKQLAVGSSSDSVVALKERFEIMEKKLGDIEKISCPEKTPSGYSETVTVKPEPIALPVAAAEKETVKKMPRTNYKENRGRVLNMWKAGRPVSEIAARTRLGKGEIELIISLQESPARTGTGAGGA